MDTDLVRSKRHLKRTDSTKSQPWWWDHHISPKNSKWLENNLEEMDRSVKRMLKLIEEDADSFAKKAEMYYQKRPELISLVEEFYRMYRSLAERYDNITGELRKSSPSDLQSQSSGVSDISAELTSVWPSNEHRVGRPPSGRRAAGFEFFLGSGGSSYDVYHKEGDDSSSITDSELESDDSSVNNYPGSVSSGCDFQALNRRVMDLETELREAKEKLKMQYEGDNESLLRRLKCERKFHDLPSKLAAYEQELRDANEKIHNSEEEISRLKSELSRFNGSQREGRSLHQGAQGLEEGAASQDPDVKIQSLSEELRVTRGRLQNTEKEMAVLKKELDKSKSFEHKLKILQNQLESAQKDAATWKNKSNADKREVVKLQERILMLKSSLASRDHEIRDLKMAVSDAEEKIFPEKAQIKAEISKLLEERSRQDELIKELESRVRCLEDEMRRASNEKREAEERLKGEIEELKAKMAEKESCIGSLSKRVGGLEREREELGEEIGWLRREVREREKRIEEMRGREIQMEEEVEKQRRKIEEGAEEKREVIRQLCFSLEHYRDECMRLRRAFTGHRPRKLPILAS